MPVALVSVTNATQRRTPARLLGRTMVGLTSALALPQAIAVPAVAALLAIADFRTLILTATAIVMLASAYVWRGRSLTQPNRVADNHILISEQTPSCSTPAGSREFLSS
jgi:hypothetical protein